MPYQYLIKALDNEKSQVVAGKIDGEIKQSGIQEYTIHVVWTRKEYRGMGLCTAVLRKAIETLPNDAILISGYCSDCGGRLTGLVYAYRDHVPDGCLVAP